MRRLILIRHSAPRVDPTASSVEWGLSEEGDAAAAALAKRLSDLSPGLLVSSPERKALETAAIIASALRLPVQVDDDLREHERATVGFLPRPAFEAGIQRLFRDPGVLVFGEESSDRVFARLEGAIARARASVRETDVALVTHGTALSIYVGRVAGVDPLAFWRRLALPAAVILDGMAMRVVGPA